MVTKTEQGILNVFSRNESYAVCTQLQARTILRMIESGHDIALIQSPVKYAFQTIFAVKTPMSEREYNRVGGKDIRHVSLTRFKSEWELNTKGVA